MKMYGYFSCLFIVNIVGIIILLPRLNSSKLNLHLLNYSLFLICMILNSLSDSKCSSHLIAIYLIDYNSIQLSIVISMCSNLLIYD